MTEATWHSSERSQEFCPFGLELRKKLAGLVTQVELMMDKDAMRDAKEKILKDQQLLSKWLDLDDMVSQMKMFDKLVEKVANGRFHEEVRIYREAHAPRVGARASPVYHFNRKGRESKSRKLN